MARAKTTKSRTNRGGRPIEVGRYFRGLPVVDASDSLRVIVNKEDVKKAKRLDPNNCVFAQACRRLFNSHAVLFLRRTAYVELPDEDGIRKVFRYNINNETHERIVTFDKTGEADEGGFLLMPPSPCKRMESHRAYSKRYAREVASGKRVPRRISKPSARYMKTMEGVRDGRGKLGINYAF